MKLICVAQAERGFSRLNRRNLYFILGFALLSPLHAYAEENNSNEESTTTLINKISVTATRSEQKTSEVPASINSKSREEIELDAPIVQRELFNSMPGVRVTQTGSTVGHMTSIRMPTNTGPYYLFLQDGIPVQSSGFFNHNGLAYTNFSTAGSTEILKGAGTALYGSDAVAATINVLSLDPGMEAGVKVKPEVGSDGFWRLGVRSGTALSDTSDILVGVSHTKSDGWRDHTASERTEATVKHIVDLDDNNSLKTIFAVNKTEAEMAGSLIGRDEFENNTTDVGNIASTLDSGLEIKRKFDFARLSTEWINESYDDTQLSTIAYLRTNRNRYTATWEPSLPQNDSKEKTLGLMFKADIKKGDLRYITGIDTEFTQSNREYTQAFDFVPSGFGSPVAAGKIYDYDVDYLAFAPYIRTEYQVTPKLRIAGGLRYDTNRFDYTNNTDDGQYALSSFARPDDDNDPTFNHLSPKLDITYAITSQQMIYGRYANGFRIPQATRLYSLRTNNIDFELDPEISDTFELGYKLANDRNEFDISVYYMVIDDTIVRRENAERERFYVNGEKTLHHGIELSVASKLTDELTTRIAFSYSKHEYDDDPVFENNEQEQAPNDVGNIRLIYKPKAVEGLTSMLEWQHVGSWWLDNENTKKYEGHGIGNIKANYQVNKKLMIFAKVNNFTDELYAESARISFGSERYTPGAPRQYFTGLEYQL